MNSKAVFDLESIIEDSTKEIEEFEEVRAYLIEISRKELCVKLKDSKIKEITKDLLSRLFPGEDIEN